MRLNDLLRKALELKASDVHLTSGVQPIARVHGALIHLNEARLSSDDTLAICKQILTEKELRQLAEKGEVDSAYSVEGLARFRVNAFKQRNSCATVLRVVADEIPSMETLKLPAIMRTLCERNRGLILVTGPTGSGKSTSLASMIDFMNQNQNRHIITLEDPIEYMHSHGKCIVNQRQIGKDSLSYSSALRAALREDPDVILVGEMRDLDTISVAITAAETGHLVLSTLHTIGAAKTVDRVIDVFPPTQQQQIRVQFSSVLEAVVSQQILPRTDGKGRVAAFEVMVANSAIRNLIREAKTHQMQTIIQTSSQDHMITMDKSLIRLYRQGAISGENLLQFAVDKSFVSREVPEF
ncbi:MAG: type IV pilus twitching motility protein PilT [Clostridiales bacterium]|jgi:twitching motility protein PilT|nr:type IV pilus twitching motility protein PilT [Clostridiales bacterium]